MMLDADTGRESSQWPMVPLGELLVHNQDCINAPEPREYPKLSVRLYGKGVVMDASADGSALKMQRHQLARPGQVILSEIWGKKGAIGFVPAEGDGALCTSHFFLFDVRSDRLEAEYLQAIFTANYLQGQLDVHAKGTTGYAAVRPAHLLVATIPLPPLHEQRRIVACVEALASRIAEARGLRRQAAEEAEALLAAASERAFRLQPGWTEVRVSDCCEQPQYGYTAQATREAVGPRLLRITDIQNGRVSWASVPFCTCPDPKRYLLRKDDLVFARVGSTGKSFVIDDCPDAVFASYLIRLRVRRLVSVGYLSRYFQTPSYWAQIRAEKQGTAQLNFNGKRLAAIRVPIPPPTEQLRIVAYLDGLQAKVDSLRQLQAQTSAELNALVPSILERAFSGGL